MYWRLVNSRVNGLEIDLRFLDLETRAYGVSSSLASSVSAADVCLLLPYSSIMLFVASAVQNSAIWYLMDY